MKNKIIVLIFGLVAVGFVATGLQAAAEPIIKHQSYLNAQQIKGAEKIAKAIENDGDEMPELFFSYFEEGILIYDCPEKALRLTQDLFDAVKNKLKTTRFDMFARFITNGYNQAGKTFCNLINENKKTLEELVSPLGKFGKLNQELIEKIAQPLSAQDILRWIKASPAINPMLQPILEKLPDLPKKRLLQNDREEQKIAELIELPPTEMKLFKGYQLRGWHTGGITAIAFSPDGSMLATVGHQDKMIKIWDVKRREKINQFSTSSQVDGIRRARSLVFSPDGSRLAAACSDSFVRIWDVKTGALETVQRFDGIIGPLLFLRQHAILLAAWNTRRVELFTMNTSGKQTNIVAQFDVPASVDNAVLSPNGNMLAIRMLNGVQAIFNIEAQRLINTGINTQKDPIFNSKSSVVACYRDVADLLASEIILLNSNNGVIVKQFPLCSDPMPPLVFSPNDKMLACYDGKGCIHLLESRGLTGDNLYICCESEIVSSAASFSPDSKSFAVGDSKGNLSIWTAKE